MASNAAPCDPCDPEIYEKGTTVAMLSGSDTQGIENYVKDIADKTGQRVDWFYMGGRAIVRAIGDVESVSKMIHADRNWQRHSKTNASIHICMREEM